LRLHPADRETLPAGEDLPADRRRRSTPHTLCERVRFISNDYPVPNHIPILVDDTATSPLF
jgi:hypothetical protein